VPDLTAMAPRSPAGRAPARKNGSIRRTTSIDMHWPDGFGKPMCMTGLARDLLTGTDGATEVVEQAKTDMVVSFEREILKLSAGPNAPDLERLIGVRGGGHSRAVIGEIFSDHASAGTLLSQLLDDFAGASLVSGWVWSLWVDDWQTFLMDSGLIKHIGAQGVVEGICTGFAPGSSALAVDGTPNNNMQKSVPVVELTDPCDPLGWHAMPDQLGTTMRRARRIDIWHEGDLLHIDAGFQDSGISPDGNRVAIHEYSLRATANRADGTLLTLTPKAHILPFPECPGAIAHAQVMVGQKLADLRASVLDQLKGTSGCTHLNDVLRSLGPASHLAGRLEAGITRL